MLWAVGRRLQGEYGSSQPAVWICTGVRKVYKNVYDIFRHKVTNGIKIRTQKTNYRSYGINV